LTDTGLRRNRPSAEGIPIRLLTNYLTLPQVSQRAHEAASRVQKVAMTSTAQSYESILREFQTRQGLYILGAGASAGEAPFGKSFMVGPAFDYVGNSRAFPDTIPIQSELNQRIIRAACSTPISRVLSGQGIRPGSMDFYLLQRLPNFHARLFLKHDLSTARFLKRRSHSYQIFQFFHPSLLLNYNLDGLATDLCSNFHRVIDVHGTIQHEYGSLVQPKLWRQCVNLICQSHPMVFCYAFLNLP
jgi:hypothetical protein